MHNPPRLTTHAALFDDMGQAMGLDLQEEAIAGRLQFDEISQAVLRCSRCAHPGQCRQLLDHAPRQAPMGQRPTNAPPDFCRNRDLLQFLQEAEG